MNIRLLKSQDIKILEEYLAPYKAECMFICSNLKLAGTLYKGAEFEGEYFGYFNTNHQLQGVIVHYWNGKMMMHARDHDVLKKLILHLKMNINRPVTGILGPNIQAEHVIKGLLLSAHGFSINSNEELYEMQLAALNEPMMPSHFNVAMAKDVPKDILTKWITGYEVEALCAKVDENLKSRVSHKVDRLIQRDSFVLIAEGAPVSLVGINARIPDMVQVGPVWTPLEHRNKGYARLLLAYTLHQEKLKGTKQAILFAGNPSAIKAYLAVGLEKIGHYRLAILEKPITLQAIEFTPTPASADIDLLTKKINQETPEFGKAHPFAFFIRDEKKKIIAGCNGSVIFGSIYTDQLWVHPAHRKNGLGHQLMEAVHDFGRKSGCSMATVAAMSFQGAKSFYEKLGYVSDFERPGYTQNSSCIFLKRSL